jgi:threonyl-tRNA synthetase
MAKVSEQYTDLDKLRHSCSHVLAQAVKRKYPHAKLGFGPPVEGGFYYDIHLPESLTDADLEAIESEMQKIIEVNYTFEKKRARSSKKRTRPSNWKPSISSKARKISLSSLTGSLPIFANIRMRRRPVSSKRSS